ncbi:MAG TPA: hypothetical protein VKF32_12105 [Thermoanaerobaculia bacterium]|nr:hypothetical protein [Thermoanaerobaculia bacterium]
MTGEAALRALAGVIALFLGRSLAPFRLAASGLLLGMCVFGLTPRPVPGPPESALVAFVLASLLAVLYERIWPPIVSEAALASAWVGVPAALAGTLALRREPPGIVFLGAASVLAGVFLWGAHASLGNAEAGWRRAAHWASSLALPAALGAIVGRFAGEARPGALAGGALAVGALAWAAPALLERRRITRELVEEARLGFLPEEEAAILARPWVRRADPRFGRADERREYVRAALLLSVARQQQRRRSGEAIRLRQLEVLSFRTRMRRALEVRAERARRAESVSFD